MEGYEVIHSSTKPEDVRNKDVLLLKCQCTPRVRTALRCPRVWKDKPTAEGLMPHSMGLMPPRGSFMSWFERGGFHTLRMFLKCIFYEREIQFGERMKTLQASCSVLALHCRFSVTQLNC